MSQAGLVALGSGLVTETLTGNDGIAVSPQGNNINAVGRGVASAGISTAGNIYTTGSNGTATVTWNQTQAQQLTNYTNVSSSPYVVPLTDLYISVDTSAIAITVQLPNAPTTDRIFYIKDRTGNAATNNITVTTVGGAVTIDGATSLVMNKAFESIALVFNGTSYEVYSANAETPTPFSWVAKAAGTPLIPNQGFYSTSGSAQSFALPTTCAAGQLFSLAETGAGAVTVTQAAGQQVRFGNTTTTLGATGTLTATAQGAVLNFLCTTQDTIFQIISSVGNFTIV